jgi:acetyl-CoA acetyltransferase
MSHIRRRRDEAVITAPVTVEYVRQSHRSAHWFVVQTLARLLDASGLRKEDIDGLCVASFGLAPDTAIGLTQYVGLTVTSIDHIPFGGASGILALRRGLRAVEAGDAQVVACIGADTNGPDSFRASLGNFSLFSRDAVLPYGAGGPNAGFALLTDYYMRHWGATREDFGKLCVAQRNNALSYPHALFKKPLTMEEYLAARPIAPPVHLFDCVMPCAGAEGFLIMTRRRAKKLGLPYVRVLASSERHNAFPDDPVQFRGGWSHDSDRLWAEGGIGPQDVSFVQTYDDYPVMSLIQLEDLGFCAKGEGPDFIRRHDLTCEGNFPVNTCGGQLSVGQAGCAGGFLGLVEAVRQLSSRNLAASVLNARFGVVLGFGMITFDRGLCSGAAVLARASA